MAERLMTVDAPADGRDDFDFFLGSWDGRQRRLKEWLRGCDEWTEFASTSVVRKTLNGIGQVDEVTMATADGPVVGLTVRVFNPHTRLWGIHWASSIHGVMGTAQIGRFENGRGLFYDFEVLDGRAILSRYLWTSSGPDACRWEQAFSGDGGATWETNWIADFTRRAETA